ncbi:MAG: TIGR03546 family protein [Pirellulales bacterium]|nr:TIGR03546 family protein [Pirellulales bacterium]
MLNLLLRPLRILAQALVGNDSPRQTAWGISIGMLVGLLPKGSLLAILLAMLLCALQVNRAAGLLGLGVFSYIGGSLDGLAHRLGSAVLTWSPAQGVFAEIYQQPLGPFWGLTNTVVVGQLLVGLYLFYPTYRTSLAAANYLQPRFRDRLMKYRVIRWLKGAEVGAQWGLER